MAHDMVKEGAVISRLIDAAGFAGAERIVLAQDASTRSYERLVLGDRRAILMKAPPGNENPPCPPHATEGERQELGWNAVSRLAASRVEAFMAVANHLNGLGFSAPQIFAADAQAGYAVIEDLGPDLFAEILAQGKADEISLYAVAGETLAALHRQAIPSQLSSPLGLWPILDFDRVALRANADLFVDWTPKLLSRQPFDATVRAHWHDVTGEIIETVLGLPRAFTLRDYHAENVLWLPERSGAARLGLLDFQDAVHGYRAWDFSMLLHDARRDVSSAAHRAALEAYVDSMGASMADLEEELALQGALNTLRILGIFSRLVGRDGKMRYRSFMPRVSDHLSSVLAHPKLTALRAWVETHAPLSIFKA
jgi:N-acetylmuramate 1-kinase